MRLSNKLNKLKSKIAQLDSAIVAFSGGTDSTFLLKAAHDVLGREKLLAVIVSSAFITKAEIAEAKSIAEKIGVKYKVLKWDVLHDDKINKNPANRCYFCKKEIMRQLIDLAADYNLKHVIEGSNLDDNKQHRPGKKALKELKIRSPLAEAGFKKREIRKMLQRFGFKNWDKPSSSCLATRFSYGTRLKEKDLKAVDSAEQDLKKLGFKQVRVRIHGDIARIEVSKNKISKLFKLFKNNTVKKIRMTGVRHICIDTQGYCSGSMDI